ncbi:hypothetical protein TraAM80_05896 [Trypanosoma rangeli]|uniref:Uncharacterized protein n=1 Tax=Trypanosoma rangeli TaxID=5698 RepID=A0A3R7NIR4_TRYRA|nr:uncharacterized protein TraAM80_05896 [Trypanosoma rangeli]RNF03216.1 hypothetical protein TraAM80_05896 [Trypanosoma rangeli]|eukprot:RNF03216.1 hypothetical protein TraAM80_05896 [Trypanosoma rangeli]
MSNNISAFKQHLWSLFQSYSYIASGGVRGGPPARRLSESGYRAIMSLLANINVINRFFLAEDEITKRESVKRMESERFTDEVWDEMISAGERLLDSVSGGTKTVAQEEEEEADLVPSAAYDYHVMRPSFEHKTISWEVLNAVLLLRLSNSLHLHVGEYVLQECRETLNPSAWLLPARSSCEAPRLTDSVSVSFQNERDSCSDRVSPETNSMPLSLTNAMRPVTQCSPTTVNSPTCSRSKASVDDKAPVNAVDVPAEKVLLTSLSLLERRRPQSKGACELSGAVMGRVAVPSSAPVGDGTATRFVDSFGERRDIKKSILTDAGPHQSSPPPRPKQSSAAIPIVSWSARIGSVKWKQAPVGIKELRQRLARGGEDQSERIDAHALFTESRRDVVSPSMETALEMWSTDDLSRSSLPLDAAFEACCVRYDDESNQRYNEGTQQALQCLGPFPEASFSPSPSPKPIPGAKVIVAAVTSETQDVSYPPVGKHTYVSKKKVLASDNAHDGSLRQCVQVGHAHGAIACGRPTGPQEAPQPKPFTLLPAKGGVSKQPMPPPSPSRRALSRVTRGQCPVQPIVPRTRAPLTG